MDAARASPGSDAASSMQQPQTLPERDLEAQMQKLKAKLEAIAKIAAQPVPDVSLHQSYPEWLEFDGFLAGLRAMGDKALREVFKQFADMPQKYEENAAKSTSGTQSDSESESEKQSESESGSEEAGTGDVSDNAAGRRAMGEKALGEILKQFADISQKYEENAARSTSGTQSHSASESESEPERQSESESGSEEAGTGDVSDNTANAEAKEKAAAEDSAKMQKLKKQLLQKTLLQETRGSGSSSGTSASASESGSEEAATDDVSDNAVDAEAKEKAAAEAEKDKRRLSKEGLAKMFETKNMTLSKGKLQELMSRIDTNGNGEIDWLEFRALARSNSDLEMFFKGLPLERVLAACFARGAADDSLEAFFRQKHSDVVAGVLKAGRILEAMIADHIKKQNEATKARASQEQAAGGAKYGAELKGGTVEKFFEGVTGICGEPHPGLLSLPLSLSLLSLSLSLSLFLPYTLYCSLSLTYPLTPLSLCHSLSLNLLLSRYFSRSFSPALFSLSRALSLLF